MSSVGAFPTFAELHKRTHRAEVNPMDKCTIFSIYPVDILEKKETIQPSRYFIPAGSPEHPTATLIEPASWWKELDNDQPLLEITVSSLQLANSLIVDYVHSTLGWSGANVQPGLFYLPGDISVDEMKKKHGAYLTKAILAQRAWYNSLVKLGDTYWARTNGNPVSVSDLMRLAAKELRLDREWMRTEVPQEQVRCTACGSFKSPLYPVCPTCKNITDIDKAKALNLKFAE